MEIERISDKNEFFYQINRQPLVLVDFYANWCGSCKLLSPVLYEFSKSAGDKVKVVKIDVDENAEIADHYKINSIPTLVLFADSKEVERKVGLTSKSHLSDMVLKYL